MTRRNLVFYPLMMLLTAAVSLALAEVALRLYFGSGATERDLRQRLELSRGAPLSQARGRFSLFGLVQASAHEDVVYELKPDLDGTFRGRSLATNSHGLRDRAHALAKPPGTWRLVGLGDSHMFGWGVAQGEAYLDVVERRLDDWAAGLDPPRRFEAINCAVPGYNTTMEVAAYEHKCRAFDPDVVVIGFVDNDFRLPHFMQPPADALASSYLVAWVKGLLAAWGWAASDAAAADLLPHDRRGLPRDVRRESRRQYDHMVGEEAYRRAMARLAQLTAPRRVPVIVLALGNRQVVVRVAGEHGFRFLNTAPTLAAHLEASGLDATRKSWRRLFQIPQDGHPSALAHQLLAEALYEEVLRSLGTDPGANPTSTER